MSSYKNNPKISMAKKQNKSMKTLINKSSQLIYLRKSDILINKLKPGERSLSLNNISATY